MSYQKLQVTNAKEVTPGSGLLNNNVGCVLYVGTGGDLDVVTVAGNEVTLTNVQDGAFIPIQVLKVLSSSTASDILALW
jgi:hypothetical protein